MVGRLISGRQIRLSISPDLQAIIAHAVVAGAGSGDRLSRFSGVLPIVKLAIASAASHRPSAKSGSVRATRLAFSIGTATGFSRLSSRFQ